MKLTEQAGPGWIWKTVGCGALVVAGLYGLGFLLASAFRPLQKVGQSQTCQSNLIRLTQASMMYSEDYDQRLQPASGWMDRISPYVPAERYFHCPAVSRTGESVYGYGMNSSLDARALEKIADRSATKLLLDSTNLGRSASGKWEELLPRPGRHITTPRKGAESKSGNFVGYADGNVRMQLDAGL